ncbi:MAG: hypothetical protein AAFO68_03935 [Pseudomonadota bacterium]
MAGFEDLLRSALAKHDNPSAETRQVIYRSSREALERMIQQKEGMPAETIALQRQKLEAAIVQVEMSRTASAEPVPQFKAAPPEPVQQSVPQQGLQPAPPTAARQPIPQPAPEQKAAPAVDGALNFGVAPPPPSSPSPPPQGTPQMTAPQPVPNPAAAPGPNVAASPHPRGERDYDGDLLREKKPYAKMLFWAIIITGLGVTLWWMVTFGPDLLRSRLDGSVPNPAPTIESGSFNPDANAGWVSVFSADSNPESIETGNEGRAELLRADGRTYARLASNQGVDNRIRFVMPPGVMEQLRGRAATFEITMQAVDGEQQFSIYCEFGALGSCGRKRFQIDGRLQPFIFDVLINDTRLASGERARLAINTDLGGTGKAVDVSTIRVRVDR